MNITPQTTSRDLVMWMIDPIYKLFTVMVTSREREIQRWVIDCDLILAEILGKICLEGEDKVSFLGMLTSVTEYGKEELPPLLDFMLEHPEEFPPITYSTTILFAVSIYHMRQNVIKHVREKRPDRIEGPRSFGRMPPTHSRAEPWTEMMGYLNKTFSHLKHACWLMTGKVSINEGQIVTPQQPFIPRENRQDREERTPGGIDLPGEDS